MEETKTYQGTKLGEVGGFDGYAGLQLGKEYTGTPQEDGRVAITLPNGRPTSVTVEQWERWFEPTWAPEPHASFLDLGF